MSVTVSQVVAQAAELSPASIRFAEGIDHATSGDRLGRIMRQTMEESPGAFPPVRAAVQAKVDELGGDLLEDGDRRELRRLWDDLRSQS